MISHLFFRCIFLALVIVGVFPNLSRAMSCGKKDPIARKEALAQSQLFIAMLVDTPKGRAFVLGHRDGGTYEGMVSHIEETYGAIQRYYWAADARIAQIKDVIEVLDIKTSSPFFQELPEGGNKGTNPYDDLKNLLARSPLFSIKNLAAETFWRKSKYLDPRRTEIEFDISHDLPNVIQEITLNLRKIVENDGRTEKQEIDLKADRFSTLSRAIGLVAKDFKEKGYITVEAEQILPLEYFADVAWPNIDTKQAETYLYQLTLLHQAQKRLVLRSSKEIRVIFLTRI